LSDFPAECGVEVAEVIEFWLEITVYFTDGVRVEGIGASGVVFRVALVAFDAFT